MIPRGEPATSWAAGSTIAHAGAAAIGYIAAATRHAAVTAAETTLGSAGSAITRAGGPVPRHVARRDLTALDLLSASVRATTESVA